jgi:serine/threonine protein kinase
MGSNIGDLTGQAFGTCTLVKPLGQGGMGAVYLARQVRPSRNVAVKILHPNHTVDDQLYDEFLARFQREADVIARLEHVNIMPIYEYGEHNNIPYLVMPYLTGGSLRDLLAKNGSLSLTEATTYIEQAASALDYAHSHGVIHRDLKPANFLLHADGRLVLADFGIARIIENSDSGIMALTHTGTIVGTPDYMAPEMAQGDPIDYRADIYELGIVLYQMLTGHVPFSGSSPYAIVIQHIQKPLPLMHIANPIIPPAVDDVLQKATAKKPAERFVTARAMALALRKAIQQVPSQSHTLLEQQQTLSTNFPSSTPFMQPQPPQVNYQIIQQQYRPIPAPIIAHQVSAKQAENIYTPAAKAHNITTLAQDKPLPYSPLKKRNAKHPGKWIALIAVLVILSSVGILASTLIHNSTQRSNDATSTAIARHSPTNIQTLKGALLYTTAMPAPCNSNWIEYKGQFDCYHTPPYLEGIKNSNELGGVFLNRLTQGRDYPTNYVVEAHMQSVQIGAFGIYFRNQPGNGYGTYTFLVYPDGTWQVNGYDNKTGEHTQLTGGTQAVSTIGKWITLDAVVKGSNFSFYINNHLVGTAQDTTYPTGTVGIAIDHDGEIATDQFSLYATAP